MTGYDNIPAGRELDALVAEKVMGWKWCVKAWTYTTGPYGYGHRIRFLAEPGLNWHEHWDGVTEMSAQPYRNEEDEYGYLPDYSTDIAAAWLVVEKLDSLNHILFLQLATIRSGRRGCFARVGRRIPKRSPHCEDITVQADSFPLAICRAALKAAQECLPVN